MRFRDRREAGMRLARELESYVGTDAVILGLPRGGAVVAFEVARQLHLPFDVLIVRKMGAPMQPELAIGAVGEEGVTVLNDSVIETLGISHDQVDAIEEVTREELDRRVDMYRYSNQRRSLRNKTAIVIDDGIATGATARAACRIARSAGAKRVVLAVPVAPEGMSVEMKNSCDEFRSVFAPDWLDSVGRAYDDFESVSDAEVLRLLRLSNDCEYDAEVDVVLDGSTSLSGIVTVPLGAKAMVVFVHGSGSSRYSPRNRQVARSLNGAGYATLLFDLLTPWEEQSRSSVFDIELLTDRLKNVLQWLDTRVSTRDLPVALFGASTGAAAALMLAGTPACNVAAVVSRGGRVDLAAPRLESVVCPVLMLVGGEDHDVLALNRKASAHMRCPHSISIVHGASHLFEEDGALQEVTQRTIDFLDESIDGFARVGNVDRQKQATARPSTSG